MTSHAKIAIVIAHAAHVPERRASLERLKSGLVGPVHVVHERMECWEWGPAMWRWVSTVPGATHGLFLNDDTIICKGFTTVIQQMVEAAPDKILSLHTNHPGACDLPKDKRWYTTDDGLVGNAYVLPMAILKEFLAFYDEDMRGKRQIPEDTCIDLFAMATGRRIWHPTPSPIDHDVSLRSCYEALGNHTHEARRPYVLPIGSICLMDWTVPKKVPHLGRVYNGNHWRMLDAIRQDAWPKYHPVVKAMDIERGTLMTTKGNPVPGGTAYPFIMTPAYSSMVTAHYAGGVAALGTAMADIGSKYRLYVGGTDSLIPRARNLLAAKFLNSPCTHLVFIDADIIFQPSDVFKLLESGHDVVGGTYPAKQIDKEKLCAAAIAGVKDPLQSATRHVTNLYGGKTEVVNRCVVARDLPTGFMCIKREVLERMVAEMPEIAYKHDSGNGETIHDFFFTGIYTEEDGMRRYLSEDYGFARRVQKLGLKCWMHLDIELGHVGTMVYRHDLASTIEPEPATAEAAQ